MRSSEAWTRAVERAGRQRGLVTRRQCLALGLHPTSLDRQVGPGGRWQRVLPGIYATFTGPLLPVHLMAAALLWCGPGSQLTAGTALALHGCRYLPADPRVHVLVDVADRHRGPGAVRVHRCADVPAPWWRDGLPLSPPDRAAVLAARHTGNLREVRALMAEVVQRRLTTVDRLSAALEAAPSAGTALPRRVLGELAAGCRSAPEMELRDLVRRRPRLLAGVRWNHPLCVRGRSFAADACWPAARLVVEVDSVEHHGFGEEPEWTARRRAALTAAGWRVLSVSPRRIREQPETVLAEIEALLVA
jgi:very-short-patch-repair endonuclease